MREWEIGAVENIHGALPYIRFAPILALVGVGLNRIGKEGPSRKARHHIAEIQNRSLRSRLFLARTGRLYRAGQCLRRGVRDSQVFLAGVASFPFHQFCSMLRSSGINGLLEAIFS